MKHTPETSADLELFGRIRPDGNVDVLDADGCPATQIPTSMWWNVHPTVWPVGSDLGIGYDHPEGIVLTREDAERIGLELEG